MRRRRGSNGDKTEEGDLLGREPMRNPIEHFRIIDDGSRKQQLLSKEMKIERRRRKKDDIYSEESEDYIEKEVGCIKDDEWREEKLKKKKIYLIELSIMME